MIRLMMKLIHVIGILAILISQPLQANVDKVDNSYFSQPDYSQGYDPERNAFDDGRAALSLAAKTNRRVVIEIGGDWCGYCHKLDRFLKTNNDVANAFFDAFVLLKINVSDENPNSEFMSAFKRVDAYPHMFVTESNGKVIYSKDTAEFVEKRNYSSKRFFEFINRWKL